MDWTFWYFLNNVSTCFKTTEILVSLGPLKNIFSNIFPPILHGLNYFSSPPPLTPSPLTALVMLLHTNTHLYCPSVHVYCVHVLLSMLYISDLYISSYYSVYNVYQLLSTMHYLYLHRHCNYYTYTCNCWLHLLHIVFISQLTYSYIHSISAQLIINLYTYVHTLHFTVFRTSGLMLSCINPSG